MTNIKQNNIVKDWFKNVLTSFSSIPQLQQSVNQPVSQSVLKLISHFKNAAIQEFNVKRRYNFFLRSINWKRKETQSQSSWGDIQPRVFAQCIQLVPWLSEMFRSCVQSSLELSSLCKDSLLPSAVTIVKETTTLRIFSFSSLSCLLLILLYFPLLVPRVFLLFAFLFFFCLKFFNIWFYLKGWTYSGCTNRTFKPTHSRLHEFYYN